MRHLIPLLLCCLALTASAESSLRLNGSVVLKGLIDPSVAEISNKAGYQLKLEGNGADNGLLDLIAGRADVAMLSAELPEVAAKINAKSPGSVDLTKLTSIKLGTARILLVVNPANPVRKLTNAQAVDLLGGKIRNWKDLGGPDMPIVVVVAPSGNGTRTAVEKQLLKGTSFGPQTKIVPHPLQVGLTVSQMPGAVGPMGASVFSDRVATLSLDKDMETPMEFVVLGDPTPDVLKLAEIVKPYIK